MLGRLGGVGLRRMRRLPHLRSVPA